MKNKYINQQIRTHWQGRSQRNGPSRPFGTTKKPFTSTGRSLSSPLLLHGRSSNRRWSCKTALGRTSDTSDCGLSRRSVTDRQRHRPFSKNHRLQYFSTLWVRRSKNKYKLQTLGKVFSVCLSVGNYISWGGYDIVTDWLTLRCCSFLPSNLRNSKRQYSHKVSP